MAQNNTRVQKIVQWREAVAAMPDELFFEIVRIYLGELKSPFNKQKLIEELGAFLRKEENKKKIMALLTDEDISILSAVYFIKDPTQEKLASFFAQDYSSMELNHKVQNLEERLFLFRREERQKKILTINPHLEEEVQPFLTITTLTGGETCVTPSVAPVKQINAVTLAAICSFIEDNDDLYKGDGDLKKRAITVMTDVFGSTEINFVIKAMVNLSLIKDEKGNLYCDYNRLKAFARLDSYAQLAYLCAAGAGNFGRSSMMSQAQLLLDTLASVPAGGMTKNSIIRTAILLRSKMPADTFGFSRFSRLMQSVQSDSVDEGGEMERLFDGAIALGLLTQIGLSEKELPIYTSTYPGSPDRASTEAQPASPKISIDAGFTITMLPGITLEEALPLAQFLQIQKCDTVAVFEANRKSMLRGFDRTYPPEKITELLSALTPYPLPQSLLVTIEEWYKAYSAASLYKGYILHTNGNGTVYAEKNPRLRKYIKAVLAPGTYLMDFSNDNEAMGVLRRSGMDSVGAIKTVKSEPMPTSFASLREGSSYAGPQESAPAEQPATRISPQEQASFLKQLQESVEKMKLTKPIAEGLLDRISRRVIVDPSQLRPESVKLEIIEAFGMDYAGKVHLIEQAIEQNNLVELKYDQPDGTTQLVLGTPLAVDKQGASASVRLQTIPDRETKELSIGQAIKVRRVRR